MIDVGGEIARLQQLREDGTISSAQFDVLKADLLRKATSPEVAAAPLLPPPPSGISLPPRAFAPPSSATPMASPMPMPVAPTSAVPSRPRTRRTIAIIVISVLVLAGIIVAIIAIAGGGGSSDEPVTTASSGSAPVDGDEYFDPQGSYTITIGSDWTLIASPVKEIEAWGIAPAGGGFTPNVNLLTQDAQGMDLQAYMDFSAKNMGGFTEIDHGTITGADGSEVGTIEYQGSGPSGTGPLHFLGIIDVRDGEAIVATLTAPDDQFDTLRAEVEPYLLTLQAT